MKAIYVINVFLTRIYLYLADNLQQLWKISMRLFSFAPPTVRSSGS